MSRETDRAIGQHLAGFLDDYQKTAERLARPYAEAAELRRRISIAAAYIGDIPCTCGELVRGDRFVCSDRKSVV